MFEPCRRVTRFITRVLVAVLFICVLKPADASAYSVLAHEAMIDAAWDDLLLPTLRQKYPGASAQQLAAARAFAYGGSLIHDLGYYPFGSRLFSNLLHYVRTGDFVAALVRGSRDVNEYAFALGAVAHYAADNLGHSIAVNRAVPIMYPKLRQEFGPEVLYADSPSRHLMVEFAFDVLQVAAGSFKADVFQQLIGFEVATPVLESAFRETYGLGLRELFGDIDLAIGTYRYATSRLIPDITRAAWREKRDEILQRTPEVTESDFVYAMTPRQYEDAFGNNYRRPRLLARFVMVLFKILPKVGPLKPLAFEPLTAEAARMFVASFEVAGERYRTALRAARAGRFGLPDSDLDTGKPPARGVNSLADDTYNDLLARHADHKFCGLSPQLRENIAAHFAAGAEGRVDEKQRRRDLKVEKDLIALKSMPAVQGVPEQISGENSTLCQTGTTHAATTSGS